MSNSTYKMNFTTKVDPYWEVFLKGKKIGLIYQTTKDGEWAWGWRLEYPEWSLPQFMVSQKKGHASTRQKAFEEIVHSNEQFIKEGEAHEMV